MLSDNDKNTVWINRQVFLRIKDSFRFYIGVVLAEDSESFLIRDVKDHLVRISKSEISFIQEEKKRDNRGDIHGH